MLFLLNRVIPVLAAFNGIQFATKVVIVNLHLLIKIELTFPLNSCSCFGYGLSVKTFMLLMPWIWCDNSKCVYAYVVVNLLMLCVLCQLLISFSVSAGIQILFLWSQNRYLVCFHRQNPTGQKIRLKERWVLFNEVGY